MDDEWLMVDGFEFRLCGFQIWMKEWWSSRFVFVSVIVKRNNWEYESQLSLNRRLPINVIRMSTVNCLFKVQWSSMLSDPAVAFKLTLSCPPLQSVVSTSWARRTVLTHSNYRNFQIPSE